MITYSIYIAPTNYTCVLVDTDAKVAFEKDDNSVIFRKRLDGKFSLNRTGNEPLYDKLMSLTYCERGVLSASNDSGMIVQSSFMKKDLTISENRCSISVKFDRQDEYLCLDGLLDKEFNILEGNADKPYRNENVRYTNTVDLEYSIGTGTISMTTYFVVPGWPTDKWVAWQNGYYKAFFPPDLRGHYFYPPYVSVEEQATYTLYKNEIKLVGEYTYGGSNTFEVTSYWIRAVRIFRRVGEDKTVAPTPDPADCNQNEWYWVASTEYPSGDVYDYFVRAIPSGDWVDGNPANYNDVYTLTKPLLCIGYETVNLNRSKKLNKVIDAMIYDCFPDGFESIFLKDTVNPISNRDLSNLMISQKSDCMNPLSSDPATKGIITLKKLLQNLCEMFQVYWAIDGNGDFRIEHKEYWDNNGSYVTANEVDIDLTVIYPVALIGTNEYTFESNIPIREKFEFGDASNIDFVGNNIDYSECIKKGDEITHSAVDITTDITFVYLNTELSKVGFCLLHTQKIADQIPRFDIVTGEQIFDYEIVLEKGILSQKLIPNAHLSWANLHDSYWKYGRYMPYGKMNGVETDFQVRALKYQSSLSFPYCIGDFDPQKLIRTNLGDGAVKTASFSFKTNYITVELEYIDNI